jgi:hypothetical protein
MSPSTFLAIFHCRTYTDGWAFIIESHVLNDYNEDKTKTISSLHSSTKFINVSILTSR